MGDGGLGMGGGEWGVRRVRSPGLYGAPDFFCN